MKRYVREISVLGVLLLLLSFLAWRAPDFFQRGADHELAVVAHEHLTGKWPELPASLVPHRLPG